MKRVKRPCDACPWRTDAEPGRFPPERWEALRSSSADEQGFGPDFEGALFACHKTPQAGERACAGWLAVEGANHPRVRLAVMTGALPVCALTPGEDWPDLHESFTETRLHDLDFYICPSCASGEHNCPDIFEDPVHGLVACGCSDCNPEED